MRTNAEYSTGMTDRALWRLSRTIDAVGDEAARFLDLAGFANDRLDADDAARIAELVVHDPAVAADIVAARSLGDESAQFEPMPEGLTARACALIAVSEAPAGTVVAFAPRRLRGRQLYGVAQWGSLAAAVVIAGWLGFTLGMDTSRSLDGSQVGEEGFLHELFDPSTGFFLHDLTTGTQT